MAETKFGGDTLTVFLKGDLDHHSAKGERSEIDREINSVHPKKLVLDFSGVTFMDSSGIGLIMGRYKLMQDIGGSVTVARPPAYIKKVLRLSGIDKLAEVTDKLPEYTQRKEEENIAAHTS